MNTYLLKSESYHLLNEEIANIVGNIESKTIFSLNDVTIYDCIDDASYYSLFTNKRAIIIKDVKFFGGKFAYENESLAIEKFLKKRESDDIIIFVCDDIKKSKDLTKKVVSLGAIIKDIKNPNDQELSTYLKEYCHKQKYKIDEGALNLIIKNCLNNYDIAIQEIDKLSLVDKHITKDIVSTYGSIEEGDYTFDFSNAVIAKNFDLAFKLLDLLISNGCEIIPLVALLANSYTNMYMVKMAAVDNNSDEEIAKLFGYSSTSRVYVLKKNGKIYTLDQLKEIILDLALLDKKIKTGYNPVYGLKEFLLNL